MSALMKSPLSSKKALSEPTVIHILFTKIFNFISVLFNRKTDKCKSVKL